MTTQDIRTRMVEKLRVLAGMLACENKDVAAELCQEAADRITELEGLIRECRLADGYAGRTGDESRWDRAFHELCNAERSAVLSPSSLGDD